MGEFFGSIYCWFEEFFGIELANYLWGESSLLSQTNSHVCIYNRLLLNILQIISQKYGRYL